MLENRQHLVDDFALQNCPQPADDFEHQTFPQVAELFLLRDKYDHFGDFFMTILSLCNVENINTKLTRNVGKSL